MDILQEKKRKLERQIENIRTQIVKQKAEEQRITDPKKKMQQQHMLRQLENEKETKQKELEILERNEDRSGENAIEIHIQTD